jgi:hypothetical protein
MAALDDSRHRDTVPPLTLWQMMQIAPFILFLREYFTAPCQTCFYFLMWGITLRFFDGNDIALAIALGVFYENKGRSWRRAARTAAARYLLSVRVWTAWELKSVIGLTTAQTYEAWARKKGAEVLTDELPEGAKLHWMGHGRSTE